MFFLGIGTAVPQQKFTQGEIWQALQESPQFLQLTSRSHALLKKVLSGKNGIATRYLAIDDLTEAFVLTPDILHQRFIHHAPSLATAAAKEALATAEISPSQIDALIISTCTGYLCPGLTSYVTERLGLRSNIQTLDLVGQGCGAALPNLRTAEALLTSKRAHHVLSICVEVCSAALYLDNDPGVLISNALFGDGAAAVVLSNRPSTSMRRIEWKMAESFLAPSERDLLRFEQRNGMLRNILTPQVPKLAAQHAHQLLKEILSLSSLNLSDIAAWILHAGGREVLIAMKKEIGLTENDLRLSSDILYNFGNISSPFVLFVLEKAVKDACPGGWWYLSSFGAGFSCYGALLKVD